MVLGDLVVCRRDLVVLRVLVVCRRDLVVLGILAFCRLSGPWGSYGVL